jgi:hypothetical protein
MSLPDGGRMSTRIFVCPRSPVGEPPTGGLEGADLWAMPLCRETSERAAVAPSGGAVVASPQPCPVCAAPLTSRKTSACSDRCRAAKSRQRRIPLRGAETNAIRTSRITALEAVAEVKTTLEKYAGR